MTSRVTSIALAAALAGAGAAEAQSIGTFSWQTQPYCNVITVEVIQHGSVYQLIGTDNLCGGGTAPVTGTAVFTGGAVAFGLTAALPSGRADQISATISLATVSGTWADADGHSGAFAFGANTGGASRPAPAPTTGITVAQLSSTVYAGTGAATTVARSDHDHDVRYYTKGQADAKAPEVVQSGSASLPPTVDYSAGARSVTTTRAGRLDVRMFFVINITCGGGGGPTSYLTVDGVPVESSLLSMGTSFAGYLVGITSGVASPGAHTIGLALDCASGAPTGSVSYPGRASVVVIP